MNDGTTSVPRKRLRTWIVLAAMVVGLLLVSILSVWIWLRSDGDIRAVEEQARAFGINLQSVTPPLTGPMRLAQAKRIQVMAAAITVDYEGRYFQLRSSVPPSEEFREAHRRVSSQAVCDLAQAIIDLGNDSTAAPPGWLRSYQPKDLLLSRIVVSEPEELDVCLKAHQTMIEMMLREREWWSAQRHVGAFCRHAVSRLPDQRERLRSMAEWLDVQATRLLEDIPQVMENLAIHDLSVARIDDGILRERGALIPSFLQIDTVRAIAMRLERARLLRAELSWYSFLATHPMQPRTWMDEAVRRDARILTEGSWLGVELHQNLLYPQHPYAVRSLLGVVLHARLLAAELRGSPWPVDVLDPAGGPLRRWEKDGRLIGAYSVGENGVDDGGDRRSDITLRLYLEPESTPAP